MLFANRGIAQRREQKVDGGTGGIDGPVEVTPTALDSNICLIDTPGFVGRLKMTAQSLFQFGTVSLHPTPDRRVIRLQTALGEQFFHIAQRERVAKIPTHGTQNQLRRRLPPLEDCRSGCGIYGLFRLPQAPPRQSCNTSLAMGLAVSVVAALHGRHCAGQTSDHRPMAPSGLPPVLALAFE